MKKVQEQQGPPESLLVLDGMGGYRLPTEEEQRAYDKRRAAAKAQWGAERPQREAAERERKRQQAALYKRVGEILAEHGITLRLSEAYECAVGIGYRGEELGTLYGEELGGKDLGQPINSEDD